MPATPTTGTSNVTTSASLANAAEDLNAVPQTPEPKINITMEGPQPALLGPLVEPSTLISVTNKIPLPSSSSGSSPASVNGPESEHVPTSSALSESMLNTKLHTVSSTAEITNNPSPTEVSDVPPPWVAPYNSTTSSDTPLPASSGLGVGPHVTKLDAAQKADGDVVMQDMTSASFELQNDKESSVKGCATESAATIPVEKVDADVVMQDMTSNPSQL